MAATKRTQTLRVLLRSGAPVFGNRYRDLSSELNAIETADRAGQRRRYLVKLLHTTRLLDSALEAFTGHYGIHVRRPSLGSYLLGLTTHGVPGLGQLPPADRSRYQRAVVQPRNRYLHRANSYPSQTESDSVLSEMHACLAQVLGL